MFFFISTSLSLEYSVLLKFLRHQFIDFALNCKRYIRLDNLLPVLDNWVKYLEQYAFAYQL